MKLTTVLTGALLASMGFGGANATDYLFDVANGDTGNVYVNGNEEWTTAIFMTPHGGSTLVVFCDDLQHYFYPGGTYDMVPTLVQHDGNGNWLGEAQSNLMGQIAGLGKLDYANGNYDGAIAAQAVIWGVEYNASVSSTNSTIESDIRQFLKLKGNPNGPWAEGFIPVLNPSWPAYEGQVDGQAQIAGIPEPSTWAMMLAGFGGLGLAAVRRSRKTPIAIA